MTRLGYKWVGACQRSPFWLSGGRSHKHLTKILYYYCHDLSLLRGFVGSWLTPDRYQEAEHWDKVMGRTHIHDRVTINTINLPSCSYALPVHFDNYHSYKGLARGLSRKRRHWGSFSNCTALFLLHNIWKVHNIHFIAILYPHTPNPIFKLFLLDWVTKET